MRDLWDHIARNAAFFVTLTFVGGYWYAGAPVGEAATIDTGLGLITASSASWVMGTCLVFAACLHAIATAGAARTPNPVHRFSLLPAMTVLAFLVTIVGSMALSEMRHAPPPALATLVCVSAIVGVVGLFSLAWAASAPLLHAEDLGPPPRGGHVVSPFQAFALAPFGIWFIHPRINAMLARPRLH